MDSRTLGGTPAGIWRLETVRLIAPAALAALFACATFAWIRLDQALPLWDEAQYLMESELLFQTLCDSGPGAFLGAFSRTLAIKAPLITALPLPFYALFGESIETARLVGVVSILIASWSLYRLGTVLAGRRAALLAVVFLNTFPLVAGLSRPLMVEYGLMTLVILWVHSLVRWRQGSETSAALALGLLLGLGMLMKVTFPLYVAGPTAVVLGWDVARFRRVRATVWTSMAVIVAVGVPIAAVWYGRNWRTVFGFVAVGGFGRLARDYARPILQHWLALIDQGFGAVAVVLAVALVAATLAGLLRRLERPSLDKADGALLLAWVAVPAVVLSLTVLKDVRFAVPYMPAVALALGAGWAALSQGRRGLAVLLLVALVCLAQYSWYSFAPFRPGGPWKVAGLHFPSAGGAWARPPQREVWPGHDVVDLVAADAHELGLAAPRVHVLFSHWSLNAHNLNYLSVLERATPRFRTLHFQSIEPVSELAEQTLEHADYVITKSDLLGDARLNQNNREVHAVLVREGFPFATIGVFSLPDGTELAVSRAKRLGAAALRPVHIDSLPATAVLPASWRSRGAALRR
jgi:4-amino-4-deoxy-L-arabinose transferase-like glycosyltransferase